MRMSSSLWMPAYPSGVTLGGRVGKGKNRISVGQTTYLWLVGNGRMVVIVVIIVPHSSIPY